MLEQRIDLLDFAHNEIANVIVVGGERLKTRSSPNVFLSHTAELYSINEYMALWPTDWLTISLILLERED